MKALRFLPIEHLEIEEVEIESFKIIEEMYIRVKDGGLSPAAYYFPLNSKEALEHVIEDFKFAQEAERKAFKSLYQLRNVIALGKFNA